ncbi:MAG TPA: lactonase family protein [Sphingomonas sp.]|nr:lactonase family protein [Sphingomonas sp.]
MTQHDAAPTDRDPPTIWIGTFAGGGGAGLYPLTRSSERLVPDAAYTDMLNGSFGTYSPRFDLWYVVDERDSGMLGTYRQTRSGWQSLGTITTAGAAPCHVALDAAQSCIAVANYMSGSVALYRLDPTSGLPIGPPSTYANTGNGPNRERQQAPHAHWVGFGLDNEVLYATDLGTDEVMAFAFDANRGTLDTPRTAFAAPPGSGPRHLLFHARHQHLAYLACELTSTLIVLDVQGGGRLDHHATLSTLPAGWQGPNIVAHIGANASGDRLYVSNRGHDSIAVFALDVHGDATPIQHIASGGESPRFFLILEEERRMVVVHERDQRVTMLDILPDGTLAPTGLAVTVPGAAFALLS